MKLRSLALRPSLLGVAVCSSLLLTSIACQSPAPSTDGGDAKASLEIAHEKYVLDNGLEVVIHEDHSDPLVAVATLVHVGSNREKPGRTGFAHFFEHMSFNDSENVPRGANRKLIAELGGSRNGGTWSDGTIYYEVVPSDAFEKVLWINSDRLGYMINTVTEAALEREKQVVKNEKRQRVDNVAYGHGQELIKKALYPEDHPYNWTVIGTLEDLQNATLGDVKEFYDKYYGAANATLVIAGAVDTAKAKELVQKWFGEIRKGPDVEPLEPRHVELEASRSLAYEDNFAKLPQLTAVYPTVEQYHEDSYALDMLASVLADSKTAPLYEVVVEEKKLAPNVRAFHSASELTGELRFVIRAAAGTDLDDVKAAYEEALARFEQNGISDDELERIKAKAETSFYGAFTSVLSKAFQLASYNEYAGDPNFFATEAERLQSVTKEQVQSVYERYLKGKPAVWLSVVPKGQAELMVADAEVIEIEEEEIVQGAEAEVSEGEEVLIAKTETSIDRSEPALGEAPSFKMPAIWRAEAANGMEVYGTRYTEVPMVSFQLSLDGGHLLDPADKPGVAAFLANMMTEGTKNRTPAELEQAIDSLGASFQINGRAEMITIRGQTLERNFGPTMELLQEILLEPRWDAAEFDRLKRELVTRLQANEGNAQAVAYRVTQRLLYGDEHPFGVLEMGNLASAESITLDDLKAYYDKNLSPKASAFHFVGGLSSEQVQAALEPLTAAWQGEAIEMPTFERPSADAVAGKVFFVDMPGAKQSVINVGKLSLRGNDPDYNNLDYANERLGGGSSARLFQILRIQKGYTYGARSYAVRRREPGPFIAQTSVRANVTLESLQILREQLETYHDTFTDEDAEVTKNQLLKSNTAAFESLWAKLGLLSRLSHYDLPDTYLEAEMEELRGMTTDDFKAAIAEHMNEDEMFYLVVGDGATQRERIKDFGLGEPIELDIHGAPVS